MTADERVASIVAYLGTVAEQQDGYARNSEGARWHPGERPEGAYVYTKRLRERAFMARALAKRIARGEDLRPGAYLKSLSTGPEPTGTDELTRLRAEVQDLRHEMDTARRHLVGAMGRSDGRLDEVAHRAALALRHCWAEHKDIDEEDAR